MKALQFKEYGGPEVMHLADLPEPQTGQRDVKIRVYSAALNPVDFKIRNGALKRAFKVTMPMTAGVDLAGEVIEVGLRARHFEAGDRVFAFVSPGHGACAETVCVDRACVAPMPKSLDFDQAAGVPLAALTAWQSLNDALKLQAGEEILIHAGAGGVGSFAIQFAKNLGARVTTTASAKKHDMLKELGADICIDYTSTGFTTLGRKFDAVFDTLGGKVLLDSFEAVKPKGRVASVSALPDEVLIQKMNLGLVPRMMLRYMARPITAAARAAQAEYRFVPAAPNEAQLRQIAELIDRGRVKVLIDSVYPLDRYKDAFAKLESGRAAGKIVLRIREEAAAPH